MRLLQRERKRERVSERERNLGQKSLLDERNRFLSRGEWKSWCALALALEQSVFTTAPLPLKLMDFSSDQKSWEEIMTPWEGVWMVNKFILVI